MNLGLMSQGKRQTIVSNKFQNFIVIEFRKLWEISNENKKKSFQVNFKFQNYRAKIINPICEKKTAPSL